MKKTTILLTLLLVSLNTLAQDSKFSATIGYPLPLSGDFLKANTGIFDIGLQYVLFTDTPLLNIGVSVNNTYLTKTRNLSSIKISESTFLIQPRIFGEFYIKSAKKIKPFAGLGYSVAIFNIKFEAAGAPPNENISSNGINLNLGVKYDFTKNIFVVLQYPLFELYLRCLGKSILPPRTLTIKIHIASI